MAKKKFEETKETPAPVTYMAIPRAWLIALIAIPIVTLIGVADIWLNAGNRSAQSAEASPPAQASRTGKWGELTLVPIVISPPMELVFTDLGFMPRPTWFFPGTNLESALQTLEAAGVSRQDIEKLRACARPEPRIAGVVFTPDPTWVRGLERQTRAHIYRVLATSTLNVDQNQAFRYPGENLDEWLDAALVSPRTRQLVEPLVYRDGNYMLFSDIQLIRQELGGDEELRRLLKSLFRQPTVIARLTVDGNAPLDMLVEYWGRGGRRSEIRPLLESIAGGSVERSIDVVHLLPPFARNYLYSYPKLSAGDLEKPTVVNCLWTALNFFAPQPDDRFLDPAVSLRTLKEDYFIVESDFELGDIVAFLDEKGDIFHAAVYIADDLLFSKNGVSAMAPWTLMSLEDVKGYYSWRSANPRLIFHRRKGF